MCFSKQVTETPDIIPYLTLLHDSIVCRCIMRMMADHQFYNAPDTCVDDAISSLAALHASSVRQLGTLPCLVHKSLDPTKVSLICGGGSGHEPAHGGYVGVGMLSGAVAGNVFASPSSSLVLELILEVTGEAGCLVIVKNYTGDCMNFGIAVEKAKKLGRKVQMVICADDTTLLDHDTLAGPRGLCGVLFVQKIAGAFAAQGNDLEAVSHVARMICGNIGTAGVAISPCVPPGREPSFTLPPATMEFGIGIHGEPGTSRCGSVDCKSTVDKLFSFLCDTRGLGLKGGDDVAIIVNNLGGTSELEMGVVCEEVLQWLELHHVICHVMYSGTYMTSLGMHGISLSVVKLDDDGTFLEMLKYPTSAPSWKKGSENPRAIQNSVYPSKIPKINYSGGPTSKKYSKILWAIISDLSTKVDELNELDRKVGDGDCGSTISGVLTHLKSQVSSLNCSSYSVFLTQLSDIVESHMGGTSGAIYTIALTAAAGRANLCETGKCEIRKCDTGGPETGKRRTCETGKVSCDGSTVSLHTVTSCLESAVIAISRYGKAREGDCTMLDVLYPVLRTLQVNTLADMATLTALCTQAAEAGVVMTATLQPRAGRAAYIRTQSTDQCADPGAVAAATWVKSVCRVLYQDGVLDGES